MRFAERLGRHATEASLLAVIAGETATPHVASCASCQDRLADLRAWVDGTAADAGVIADRAFTADHLAAQKQQVLARLEAAGRSARVIAFPFGPPAPSRRLTQQAIGWAAAAALGGILVGLASGRLLDPHTRPQTSVSGAPRPQTPPLPARTGAAAGDLDEAALLDAAYDRVSLDSLQTIEDMTPRAREVVLATMPRSRR